MAEFFFFLAILLQCGLFPMSPDDCYSRAVPPPIAETSPRALASPEESP